jgi:uncharacterized protein with PQ loop repeat
MNIFFRVIGYLGSVMLSVLMLPQIHTTYKTKEINGISVWFLIFELIATLLWIIYGIGFLLENNPNGLPIVIANSCLFVSVIILLVMKYKYSRK